MVTRRNPLDAIRGITQPVISYVNRADSFDTNFTRMYLMYFPFTVTTEVGGAVTAIAQPTHRSVPSTHKAFIRAIKGVLNFPAASPQVAMGIMFDLQEPGKSLRFFSDAMPFATLVGGATMQFQVLYARSGWMLESNSEAVVTISTDVNVVFPAVATTYRGGIILECDLIPRGLE